MMGLDRFNSLNSLSSISAAAVVADEISGRLANLGQIPGINKRIYYCQRCLNHGKLEPRKNHKCDCIYANCACPKCILVEKRRVLNTQLHELEDIREIEQNDSRINQTDNINDEKFINHSSTITNEHLTDFHVYENNYNHFFGKIKGASAMNPLPFSSNIINSFSHFKESVSYTKRIPNCQKCGQHGRKSRLKGHKRVCPYKDCNCPKCQVVTERQKLMADQIKIRRRQRKDTIMNLTRDKITATLNAAAAVATGAQLPYFNNLNNLSLLYNQLSQNSTIQTNTLTESQKQSAFTPVQTSTITSLPTTNLLTGASSADLIKAAVAISTTANDNTSLLSSQFPSIFLQNNQQNSLNVFNHQNNSSTILPLTSTTNSDGMTIPTSSMNTVITDDTENINNTTPSPSGRNSNPPDIDTNIPAPIPINPLTTSTTTTTLSLPQQQQNKCNNLPTQEQLLAFLANVQLSNCFPNLNSSTNNENINNIINTSTVTSTTTSTTSTSTNNCNTNNTFVDICSV